MTMNKKPKKVTKEKIVEKAMGAAGAEYRRRLLHDPKGTLKTEFGIIVPDNIEIKVVEETKERFYLVIPAFPNEDDMELRGCGW